MAPEKVLDSESEGSEDEADVFEVEAILDHKPKKAGLAIEKYKFYIKWKGYEETTWEPYENCEGALDMVTTYFDENISKQQGKEKPRSGKKSKGRSSSTAGGTPAKKRRTEDVEAIDKPVLSKDTPTQSGQVKETNSSISAAGAHVDEPAKPLQRAKPKSPTKQRDSSPASPPAAREESPQVNGYGDEEDGPNEREQRRLDKILKKHADDPHWEDRISLTNVMRTSDGELVFTILWDNKHDGNISNELIREKAPQRVIDFYEKNLRFSE